MKGTRPASRYAKAILALAKERNLAEKVNADFQLIHRTIDASGDLRVLLKSPVVNSVIKKNTLDQIFKDVNELTHQVFDLLLKNNRVDLLALIAIKYQQLFDQMNNQQIAYVTSAIALTQDLETKIQAKVREFTGNEAKIENQIDQDIIGGFILRVGDLQYDASIASQLGNLERELQNNTYVSKL